jgi:hypothetical protein
MYSYCCLCILIVVYVFLDAATLTDGARPALFQNCCVVLCIVCFVSFYVLFVCKCVLYFGGTPTPDHRPATYWVQHTTSCIAQSNAPEDGQNRCPKHVELIWIYQ